MFETFPGPLKNMLDLLNLLRWLGNDGWRGDFSPAT
jgi:hypothetical protein